MDARVNCPSGSRSSRLQGTVRFLQARLSPEGYLGLHLTIGMVLIVLTCWSFGEIAEDYSEQGWLATMDGRAAQFFAGVMTPTLTSLAKAITFLGSVAFVTASAFCLALVLALRKAKYQLMFAVLTMLGGSLLNIMLKHLFHRQRPVLENPVVTLSSYGFPSGHTMGSALLWGCVAIIAANSLPTFASRALIFLAAALGVAIIGATRIYLGAHYFTDVVGAVAASVAWLAFCWTAVETLRKWRVREGSPRS